MKHPRAFKIGLAVLSVAVDNTFHFEELASSLSSDEASSGGLCLLVSLPAY